MGEIEFPTGDILVRDPLVWLNRDEKAYLTSVPRGKYRIETLVVKLEEDHYRYALSRVRFTENVPKIYYEALNVDAGLATIVDVETRNAYCDFKDKWYAENPNKNIYDDFFAEVFAKNAEENPVYQREGGDWINFKIPNSELSIPMIQSGFGDGRYPVYFGYDENGELCDLVVEYIYLV